MPGIKKIKLLVSPVDLREALMVAGAGVDILDLKNIKEGSLGANFPWVLKRIISRLSHRHIKFSAAIGDLDFKPGTAALAAYAAATIGADYVKAGLYRVSAGNQAFQLADSIVKAVRAGNSRAKAVISGYADWRRFGGIAPLRLLAAAKRAGADVVMLDTAVKDGHTLFDNMARAEVEEFLRQAGRAGIKTALAGSLAVTHLPLLRELAPDIIGLRGAVCLGGDRSRAVCPKRLAGARDLFSA